MDAWETLISGSTLVSGDAWEHLNSQDGGGGAGTYLILADGLEVEMATDEVEIIVDQQPVEMVIDTAEILVEIDQSLIEVEC